MAEEEAPEAVTEVTQMVTSVTESRASWFSSHLVTYIALLLTLVVCWLALRGDRDAIVALMGSYGTLIGVLFGSGSALKVPGRDT